MRDTYHVVRCIGAGGVSGVSAVRFTLQVQFVTEAGLCDVALQQRVNNVRRSELIHTPTTRNGVINTHANYT